MNKDEAEQGLSRSEARVLAPGGECGWMGVWVGWVSGRTRDGCTLKRQGHYGRFTYIGDGEEMARNQALSLLAIPMPLRQATMAMKDIKECSLCGLVVVGPTQAQRIAWLRIWNHETTTNVEICLTCRRRIVSGQFHLEEDVEGEK